MKKLFSIAIFTLAVSTSGVNAHAEQNPIEALENLVENYNKAKPAYEKLLKTEKVGLGLCIDNLKKPGLDGAFMDESNFVSQIDHDYLNKTMRLNKLAYDISVNTDLDVPTMARKIIQARKAALAEIKAEYENATTSKGWIYNSHKKMTETERASIQMNAAKVFGDKYAAGLKNASTLMDFQKEFGKFEKKIKDETQPSFVEREIQDAYNEAIKADENLITWNHDFKDYQVVDSFLRNGTEFGGFILYNKIKNDMIVVVPGTKSLSDWFKNVQVWGKKGNASTGAGVGLNIHKGFATAYEQSIKSIKSAFNAFLEKNMDNIKSTKKPFTCHITGHSLGAAIATILAYDFKANLLPAKNIEADIKLVTVASPRLFDEKSAGKVEKTLGRGNMLRIFNVWDVVPTIVPEVYNSKHVGVDFPLYDSLLDEAYMGPMVVNHFMDRYMHLIDEGFDLLKENLSKRLKLKKVIDNFNQNYATAYENFRKYVNENDEKVNKDKEVLENLKKEVSDDESDSDSESYDKIRKNKRSAAMAKKRQAAKIAAQDLSKAKELKAQADYLEKQANMASMCFNHALCDEITQNKMNQEELNRFLDELNLED